jgi:uracil phosphoribosyltransferase
MHQGFLNMFDKAENAFISAYRKETIGRRGEMQIEIVSEYLAAPSIEGKTLILVDPMLATGLSMEVAYKALLSHGTPKRVHIACLFGTPQAIEYLTATMPEDVTLWCAVVDPMLNEKKYIVPGLGDAGDLCFGEKL